MVMAYLSTIIDAIETHFKLEVKGEPYRRTEIDGVRFAAKSDASHAQLMPAVLYLADYKQFHLGEWKGNVLYIGCGDDTLPDACMYIREAIDPAELYNVISDSLLSDLQIRQKRDALFQCLYAGKGIPGLLQAAYDVLNNPIIVLDNVFATLAFYPKISGPFVGSSNGIQRLSHRTLSSMLNQDMIQRIRHSVYPFRIYVEELGHELIFESIRIQRTVVGHICIRCCNRGIDENELDYIHSLSQMISIQLHQNDSCQNPHGIKYDLFIKYLLTHHFDTEENARKHLSFLNIQPKANFYLVACGFGDTTAKRMTNDLYCRQLSNLFANSITGAMGDRFITLISTDDAAFFSAELLDQLEAFLTMNKMKASISYVFDALLEARNFFEQCVSQLNYLLISHTKSPIGFYSDHYIRHLVELSESYDVVRSIIHPSILRMDSYDKEHQTSYLHTLVIYFNCNRSAPATAKALFIHKSTLFYRFNKMTSLFGIDFDDKDALFAYEFSLHLMEILSARKRAEH
jgi:hypothetical protein